MTAASRPPAVASAARSRVRSRLAVLMARPCPLHPRRGRGRARRHQHRPLLAGPPFAERSGFIVVRTRSGRWTRRTSSTASAWVAAPLKVVSRKLPRDEGDPPGAEGGRRGPSRQEASVGAAGGGRSADDGGRRAIPAAPRRVRELDGLSLDGRMTLRRRARVLEQVKPQRRGARVRHQVLAASAVDAHCSLVTRAVASPGVAPRLPHPHAHIARRMPSRLASAAVAVPGKRRSTSATARLQSRSGPRRGPVSSAACARAFRAAARRCPPSCPRASRSTSTSRPGSTSRRR